MSTPTPSAGAPSHAEVVVVGAGLAGLACARTLRDAGREVVVLEADDEVGGRVRTEQVDGFLADRGFQLLNPSYPALRHHVDVPALGLQSLPAGAALRTERGLLRAGHPLAAPRLLPDDARLALRRPRQALAAARFVAPLARAAATRRPAAALLARDEDTTLRAALDRAGLRGDLRRLMDRFLAGVVLDEEGQTSAAFVRLLLRSFALGTPGLPSAGMGALPHQLAAPLAGAVHLQHRVERIERTADGARVHHAGGSTGARHVVVATDGWAAEPLTGLAAPTPRGVVTQWWAVPEAPERTGLLHLDGFERPRGPVVNCAVISAAAPTYAPPGRHLVQASAVWAAGAPAPQEQAMARHAAELLGAPGSAAGWQLLARHEVAHALPALAPPFARRPRVVESDGVVVAGDHRETASIQGALVSGRRAAHRVLEHPALAAS